MPGIFEGGTKDAKGSDKHILTFVLFVPSW
jgi:hypothetical protein